MQTPTLFWPTDRKLFRRRTRRRRLLPLAALALLLCAAFALGPAAWR